MRTQFRAYYSPTAEEFERLWTEAIIVFDANTLLNLFRYSANTRDEWLALLEKEKSRLWIPHQIAFEFHNNRRLIAKQQEKAFSDVEKALEEAKKTVQEAINGLRRHPTLEAEELSGLLDSQMNKVSKKFRKARSRHFKAVVSQDAHEQTLEEISTLYDGQVGAPYSDEQLKALYKAGGERYAKKVPPGYMDEPEKKGDEKYGDLVLWKQILDHGANEKKPLIFVTDDSKEDWWLKSSGKTFGPRPELVAEYFDAAGERAHFYQPRTFLKFANERGEQISALAIAEAQSVSSAREPINNYSTKAMEGAWATVSRDLASHNQEVLGAISAQIRDLFASVDPAPGYSAAVKAALSDNWAAAHAGGAFRALADEESRRAAFLRKALGEMSEEETDDDEEDVSRDAAQDEDS